MLWSQKHSGELCARLLNQTQLRILSKRDVIRIDGLNSPNQIQIKGLFPLAGELSDNNFRVQIISRSDSELTLHLTLDPQRAVVWR